MFEMLNMYQKQMKMINDIRPVCLPQITQMHQTAQQITDVVNEQMKPMQKMLEQFSEIQRTINKSLRPFRDTLYVSQIAKRNNAFNEMVNQFKDVTRLYDNLNQEKLNILAQSLSPHMMKMENLSKSLASIHMSSAASKLQEFICNIPDSIYDTILEGEKYTRRDIEDEIASLEDEKVDFSIEGLTPNEIQQKFWKNLWLKHPKLASSLVEILVVLAVITEVMAITSLLNDIVIPATQTAIVYLQQKENSYFVKVNSAKIYEEPNSHAPKIANALYGDEINKLEDTKLWVKILYKTPDGQTIIGWIAKRNLMPYRDYEFDSDKLYE